MDHHQLHEQHVKDDNCNEISELEIELRRGPWTVEEDMILINYIALHGEGRWNSLARSAGLKRTGKSCRLRWLNYLRPDVRRGNITLEEQLLILELHSRWGNRWSKIAQHLPGRTDNEIKNYWRTRVQKHAKQLKCDVNSKQFKDTMRYLWMPRLVERIQAAKSHQNIIVMNYSGENDDLFNSNNAHHNQLYITDNNNNNNNSSGDDHRQLIHQTSPSSSLISPTMGYLLNNNNGFDFMDHQYNQWIIDGGDHAVSDSLWNNDDHDMCFLNQ